VAAVLQHFDVASFAGLEALALKPWTRQQWLELGAKETAPWFELPQLRQRFRAAAQRPCSGTIMQPYGEECSSIQQQWMGQLAPCGGVLLGRELDSLYAATEGVRLSVSMDAERAVGHLSKVYGRHMSRVSPECVLNDLGGDQSVLQAAGSMGQQQLQQASKQLHAQIAACVVNS
jgi:hypothetical protein